VTGNESLVAAVKDNASDFKQSETDRLILEFSFPPSVNHYLGRRGHHTYKTAQAKAYNAEVYALVLQAHAALRLDTPLTVWYQYWFPDKRKRDVANYEKVLTDSMVTANVMVDDHLIYDIRQTKMGYCKGGKVRVIISPHVQDLSSA
jgi:crossover junction endodeoxyribonuclease RusA